jgi:hypothetical protein
VPWVCLAMAEGKRYAFGAPSLAILNPLWYPGQAHEQKASMTEFFGGRTVTLPGE